MLRQKVRQTIQSGTLQSITAQEINSAIAEALNSQLKAEQEAVLGRAPYERMPGSTRRNGFKAVDLPGFLGGLQLRRPVVRRGWMRSPLLLALKKAAHIGLAFLSVRSWLRGLSTRSAAEEINTAFGTKLSASSVSALTNALEPVIRTWENRRIPAGIQYLFLDALYLPVRRKTTVRQALLVAMGVTAEGQRHILGIFLGDREAVDSWTALLKDLKDRGLKRDDLRLVISDDHKAILSSVTAELAVPHQLCVVHKLRNIRLRVAAPDRDAFLADFKAIFWAESREMALQAVGRFQARWEARYPRAVTLTLDRLESFTRFFDEPRPYWTLLRCTNLLERFNRELRRRLDSAGAMQSELEVLKLVWAVSVAQEKRWTRKLYRPRRQRVALPLAA